MNHVIRSLMTRSQMFGDPLPRSCWKSRRGPFEFSLNQWFAKTDAAMGFIAKCSGSRASSCVFLSQPESTPFPHLRRGELGRGRIRAPIRNPGFLPVQARYVKATGTEAEGIATKISLGIRGAVDQANRANSVKRGEGKLAREGSVARQTSAGEERSRALMEEIRSQRGSRRFLASERGSRRTPRRKKNGIY